MKVLSIYLIIFSNFIATLTFEELDYIRSFTDSNSPSIIQNGTSFCNNYFAKNSSTTESRTKNHFICKFSKIRDRFYIYKLAVNKRDTKPLKEFCEETLSTRPEISQHMDEKFEFQEKEYLSGFFIENLFNNKILNFSNEYTKDKRKINNEINNYIFQNRFNFSDNNQENNLLVQNEINKINKIYKKFISKSKSDLDILIKQLLNKSVRYKIFVNDIKNFKSYSCNWRPGKGIEPYVKRERFSEFENI